jgi:hypothetical protein
LLASLAALVPCAPASAGAGALAASSPKVSFASPGQYAEPGALCTLRVMVDHAVDSLSCMEIVIRYDTAYAVSKGAIEGTRYKQSGYPTFFRWERIPPDTVTAVDCVLGYRSCILAPGEIVRFVFQAKVPGICHVSFASIRLWDIDRVELSPLAGERTDIVVGASTGNDVTPPRAGELRNYPNPFNPSTVLSLLLPRAEGGSAGSEVRLDIFSVSGERVRALFAGAPASGALELVWDGRNDRGAVVPTGVYIGVARTERRVFTRKMIMVR